MEDRETPTSPVWDQATVEGIEVRAQKSGTLLKWVNYVAGWQKRYFDLQGGVLTCVNPSTHCPSHHVLNPAPACGSRGHEAAYGVLTCVV